jgi:5-methylcytosine-specific restriction endonuclease McrA
MAKGKKWLKSEDEFLLLHCDMGAIWIGKQLKRSQHSVNQRACKLRTGLGSNRKKLKVNLKSRVKPFVQKKCIYPRKPSWRFMRELTLVRDSYICVYCGRYADTVDHVVAKSKGGTDALINLVAACRRCNTLRGTSCVNCPDWRRNAK